MAIFTAEVEWSSAEGTIPGAPYSRAHTWRFDGGLAVPASSSPHAVPVPESDPAAVDPEEALVAAASSCHMLWFLAIAATQGWTVLRYLDRAQGELGRFPDGREGMVAIALRPEVVFADPQPSAEERDALHAQAHHRCYIANSLRARLTWRA
ncbi:OsmC/Ohr family protein [plant metagenome]|uniref:OsmC/Ohr family protein n=1 Tax=plant metagenome TaxID=1297885 RepID=A0A484S290_9ZZZZ